MGKKKWVKPEESAPSSAPVENPAPASTPQGRFTATISVSPSIMKSRNLTADSLQVALNAALQALVRYEKTISVSVAAALEK
jgi:hypothetical protein